MKFIPASHLAVVKRLTAMPDPSPTQPFSPFEADGDLILCEIVALNDNRDETSVGTLAIGDKVIVQNSAMLGVPDTDGLHIASLNGIASKVED